MGMCESCPRLYLIRWSQLEIPAGMTHWSLNKGIAAVADKSQDASETIKASLIEKPASTNNDLNDAARSLVNNQGADQSRS